MEARYFDFDLGNSWIFRANVRPTHFAATARALTIAANS
jgi:hypothetical protein